MKTIVLFFSLLIVSSSFAQDNSLNDSGSKFYFGTSFHSNITSSKNLGVGLKVLLGYNITDNLSVDFSTGYMTSFTDPHYYLQERSFDESSQDYIVSSYTLGRMDHKFMPFNLSINYKFDVFGVQPYASMIFGYDYHFSGNSTHLSEKKYESTNQLIESSSEIINGMSNGFGPFHMGLGVGVLVPVSNQIKLNISYKFISGINSLGVGLNYRIK